MQSVEDHRLPGLPRYIRINTLKLMSKPANKALRQAGYHLCPDPSHPGKRVYYKDDDVSLTSPSAGCG